MNKLDILSKLLATENINLLEVNDHTASFDITTRTLRIPANSKITDCQKLMMVLHEVGHALFTTDKYITNIKEYNKANFSGYMNAIEDARIERLIKNKFPGSRKDFVIGYNEFYRDDFFGIASKNINSLPLIDRINLHCKLGSRIGINFTRQELVFVKQTEFAITEEQVYDIAKKVYEFAANESGQDTSSEQDQGQDEDTSDCDSSIEQDEDSGDQMEQDSDSTPDSQDTPSEQDSDEKAQRSIEDEDQIAPQAQTQDSFDECLKERSGGGFTFKTFDLTALNHINVIPVHEIVADISSVVDFDFRSAEFRKNKIKNSRIVDRMISDFERKKSAEARKLTKVAKSGELDLVKLSEYKLVDDIFKRYTITADVKNHGIVMMLDWSSSMYSSMGSLINQTLILIEFCQRANIKFEVFAFSDSDYMAYVEPINTKFNTGIAHRNTNTCVNMIQWFSSGMKKSQIDLISSFLFSVSYDARFILPSELKLKYGLMSTPLVVSTLFLRDYIPTFKHKYNLQKISAVIITDGDDTAAMICAKTEDGKDYTQVSTYGLQQFNLFDRQTNKTYKLHHLTRRGLQNIAVRSIQDRYEYVTVLGFFIAGSKRSVTYYFHHKLKYTYKKCDEAWDQVKKFGVSNFDMVGYDNYFIIPCNEMNNELDLSDVSGTMEAKQISRAFITANKNLNRGKVLATKFIEAIA